MKIGQGKSKLRIRPNLAIDMEETSKINRPDNPSKTVDDNKMKTISADSGVNIAYTYYDPRENE